MIKANELRIGSVIWHTRMNLDTTQVEDFVCVVDGNLIKSLELHPYLGYNPMPLTPEIVNRHIPQLYKVGFDFAENFKCELYLHDDIKSKVWVEQYGEGKEPLTHIKYVHQLQDLYRALTGEELEITL